jgi:GT2 family glycosyltransferase
MSLPDLPRISVVMPSLDQVDFLSTAVDSVLAQGLADVELIVADGGSTDGSQARLAELARRHPGRLRWTSGPDGGPAAAVNAAVRLARAPLLGWLNSDDVLAEGALQRAADHFEQHPDDVAVYGHGEHVDLLGRSLGRYPTLPPDTPIERFRDGCFICQPTMWMRRSAWIALGGLDETLGAAFDFEMWLRLFKACAGRIGFIDAVLAQSRLHAGGITRRQRERVAFEGLAVLRRHLGEAPPQWLLTHVAERCAEHPFAAHAQRLDTALDELAARAAPLLDAEARELVRRRIAGDRAVQLSSASLFVAIEPDGWALERTELRWRQPDKPAHTLALRCRHARPGGGALVVDVQLPDGRSSTQHVEANGEFTLALPIADRRAGALLLFVLRCDACFVPADTEPGSTDRRRLAFQVLGCEALDA